MPLEVGVRLPVMGPLATGENVAKVARWAQELGFHCLWASDHVVLPQRAEVQSYYPYAPDHRWQSDAGSNWLDPLTALTWAAAAAPDVKVGTSVLVLPLRHPVILAKQLATLDHLSGGRVLLGAGAGWMAEEFEMLGASFPDRGKQSVAMVELMRALWSGQPVELHGRRGTMQPQPVNGRVPVLWGGHSDAALRRVAGVGDGWLPLGLTLDELAAGLKKVRELCQDTPRDFQVVVNPGRAFALTSETYARLEALGVNQVVAGVPQEQPDLADCHEAMLRAAELCHLMPR